MALSAHDAPLYAARTAHRATSLSPELDASALSALAYNYIRLQMVLGFGSIGAGLNVPQFGTKTSHKLDVQSGMKGIAKTAAYIAAAALVGVFAYLFVHEQGLVVHQGAGASRARMQVYVCLFVLSLIGLLVICAYEVTKFFRDRAEKWILQGRAPTGPVPELEEAERIRASGRPLDAIGLIREYLQTHPYELHVMSRIAEIYRYDLNNDLAAALEYEELLKHKLPDDEWAWAALHLAKLYGRRRELDKSVALLERLDTEYGHTVAGRRAKKAMEQMRNPGDGAGEAEEAEDET